jgi:hypothetical protein
VRNGSIQAERKRCEHQPACSKVKYTLIRICLWLVSLLIADAGFSLFFGFFSFEVFAAYFVVTLLIAWPAWCLYLPFVIAFKDAEGRRIWILASVGVLIGPLSLLLWDAIDRLQGVKARMLGMDPLHSMGGVSIVLALAAGSLTTCAYVYGLKIQHNHAGLAICD